MCRANPAPPNSCLLGAGATACRSSTGLAPRRTLKSRDQADFYTSHATLNDELSIVQGRPTNGAQNIHQDNVQRCACTKFSSHGAPVVQVESQGQTISTVERWEIESSPTPTAIRVYPGRRRLGKSATFFRPTSPHLARNLRPCFSRKTSRGAPSVSSREVHSQ